jgi:hypothetical protein
MKQLNRYPTTTLLGIYIIGLVFFYFLAITCSGCTTQKRFQVLCVKHPQWLASECTKHFAPKETTEIKQDTVKADNTEHDRLVDSLLKLAQKAPIIVADTIYSEKDCNELIRSQDKTIKSLASAIQALKNKPCDTAYIRTTVTKKIVDKAREYLLEQERDKALKGKNRAEMQRNWATGIALALLALHFIKRRM